MSEPMISFNAALYVAGVADATSQADVLVGRLLNFAAATSPGSLFIDIDPKDMNARIDRLFVQMSEGVHVSGVAPRMTFECEFHAIRLPTPCSLADVKASIRAGGPIYDLVSSALGVSKVPRSRVRPVLEMMGFTD